MESATCIKTPASAMTKPVDTNAPAENFAWETVGGEVKSDTHLEDDKGTGANVVIRSFVFSVNPESFKQHKPSKQELFNYHTKQIQVLLWEDDLVALPHIAPGLKFNKKNNKYIITVGAQARKGRIFHDKAKTLSEVVT